ncbi:MAG TPA: hypothetical protein VIH36_16770 [Casimicrobiaceae bacterium]|jgi:hypothetical protein
MDAWIESLVLAIVVIAAGFVALGSRADARQTWLAAASSPPTATSAAADVRCIALHAGPRAHQPKCATSATPLTHESGMSTVLHDGD